MGIAYLIGAGPGRADLITVRGLHCLQIADVVLYDRLTNAALLNEAPPTAERIFVGKGAHFEVKTQSQINALLVQKVRAGHTVARLKGGDPVVFARGGDEATALAQAKLPFEIVPGVSSALAAPAYAGIPVTHQNIATSFVVVTGHENPAEPHTLTNWPAVAQIHTIVILMGLRRIQQITTKLLAAGRAPNTPAAVIHQATTPQQRTLIATLATLPEAIRSQQIPPPAVIIIGDVVAFHDKLAWFAPTQTQNDTPFHPLPP